MKTALTIYLTKPSFNDRKVCIWPVKTLWEKEKKLVTSSSTFFVTFFLPFQGQILHLGRHKFVIYKCVSLGIEVNAILQSEVSQ